MCHLHCLNEPPPDLVRCHVRMSKTYHVNEEVDSHNTWISWVDSGYDKVVSKIPISTSVNSQVMIWPDRVMTTIKQTRTKKRTSFSNHTTQNVA